MWANKLQHQQVYRRRFDAQGREVKKKVWQVLVRSFFQKWVRTDHTVLDVGCGYGEFLNHICCKRRVGVDLNPDSAAYLDKGVEFYEADVRDLSFLPDGSVDVAFTSNVREHLPSKNRARRL